MGGVLLALRVLVTGLVCCHSVYLDGSWYMLGRLLKKHTCCPHAADLTPEPEHEKWLCNPYLKARAGSSFMLRYANLSAKKHKAEVR